MCFGVGCFEGFFKLMEGLQVFRMLNRAVNYRGVLLFEFVGVCSLARSSHPSTLSVYSLPQFDTGDLGS